VIVYVVTVPHLLQSGSSRQAGCSADQLFFLRHIGQTHHRKLSCFSLHIPVRFPVIATRKVIKSSPVKRLLRLSAFDSKRIHPLRVFQKRVEYFNRKLYESGSKGSEFSKQSAYTGPGFRGDVFVSVPDAPCDFLCQFNRHFLFCNRIAKRRMMPKNESLEKSFPYFAGVS
jgi:hypothetical protein